MKDDNRCCLQFSENDAFKSNMEYAIAIYICPSEDATAMFEEIVTCPLMLSSISAAVVALVTGVRSLTGDVTFLGDGY